MTQHRAAAVLIVAGSAIFLLGAAIGVPTVFMQRHPHARLRLLQANLTSWRTAQPLYGFGPLLVAAGIGVLATEASTQPARTAVTIAFLAFATGALAWAWSVYQRATRIAEFAHSTLPQWPFTTYILLTIGGLALLAIGLLADNLAPGIAWATIVADLTFLAAFLTFSDLPPFVFYLLLPTIAAVLW